MSKSAQNCYHLKAKSIKKRYKALLLADGGNSEHFFDIRVDLELVSIKWIFLCETPCSRESAGLG